jgi:peptide deformylase
MYVATQRCWHAAPQVSVNKRIIVVTNITPEKELEYVAMINPKLLPIEKGFAEKVPSEEGCLSFPGLALVVPRDSHILVKYQDISGEEQRLSVGGFLSYCIQHEIDHLDGIPFVYRVPRQQRRAALKQLKRGI